MEFLDKEKLKIREAKKDRSIYLFTTIILIPCFLIMLTAFLLAFLPAHFTQTEGQWIHIGRIGYFRSYNEQGTANPADFQWGWLNNLMVCCCVGVGILLILVFYFNFFQTKRTIMNRYAYIMCIGFIVAIVLSNIFGQIAGRASDDRDVYGNWFTTFFTFKAKDDKGNGTYEWNEAGIAMLSFIVVIITASIVMVPLWIADGVDKGQITRETGKIMLMKDETSKMLVARDVAKDQPIVKNE